MHTIKQTIQICFGRSLNKRNTNTEHTPVTARLHREGYSARGKGVLDNEIVIQKMIIR